MKVFLDTNIWLRFFLADEPEQYQDCLCLMKEIEKGSFSVYTSAIVLLEINYVLSSLAKLPRKEVQNVLETVLMVRNLRVLEQTDFNQAFSFYLETGVKLADCLIASQISEEMVLCTYDADFNKFGSLTVKKPEEILQFRQD